MGQAPAPARMPAAAVEWTRPGRGHLHCRYPGLRKALTLSKAAGRFAACRSKAPLGGLGTFEHFPAVESERVLGASAGTPGVPGPAALRTFSMMDSMRSTDNLARVLWDYMLLRHEPAPADVILVLGSNDVRVGEHGARLFLRGLAPLMVCSGNVGRLTAGRFVKSEAETFADAAVRLGVPRPSILIEAASTNTGENIDRSRELLASAGVQVSRVIVVQKPYMERRAWATFKLRWPEPELQVTSPPIAYDEYPTPQIPRDLVINILVGDVQRMRVYAERGFQVPQPMPDEVWAAWTELVARGYTGHLLT